MPDNGGRKMIENVTREALADAKGVDPAVAPGEQKVPSGCVERVLNFRDRNLLIGACRAFCAKDGHKGIKDQSKLDRMNKLISFDETLEYIAMLDDAQEELTREWTRDKGKYKAWRDYQEKIVTAEAVLKAFPGMDLDKGAVKPPLRMSENSPEEMRGKERAFYLPSKLDSWVQDAVRAMEWSPFAAEYAVELCAKFGIKGEDLG